MLLAFALMNLSVPSINIVDQMMRKTAGGKNTNKSNTSAYRVRVCCARSPVVVRECGDRAGADGVGVVQQQDHEPPETGVRGGAAEQQHLADGVRGGQSVLHPLQSGLGAPGSRGRERVV